MDASVRTYEPKTALFAENNGLALYQQLIHESQTMLKADGKIYFEIGFQQGAALQELLSAAYPQKQLKLKRFIWQRSPRDSRVTKVLRRHFSRRSDLQWKQKLTKQEIAKQQQPFKQAS